MRAACPLQGCPKDKVWIVVQYNKIVRLTFSKSLAEFISSKLPDSQVQQVEFIVSRKLEKGQKSKSGLYGITNKRDGWMLRICMSSELAEMFRHDSREVVEVWLRY